MVIGASAGGVPALLELASGLPRELPAALFVVVHSSPDSPGFLPQMVDRAGPLAADFAMDGAEIHPGRFHVAPPDRHLLLDGERMCVTRGPQENGFRPAVDPLFRTAARTLGPRVTGIVLSGGLNDGTHGLQEIKRHGGVAMVQHVDDAVVPSMPLSAIRHVEVDYVLPVREMPAVITRLASEPLKGRTMARTRTARKDVAVRGTHALHQEKPAGTLAPFTCPACGGTLWESRDGKLLSFNCHVGHGFTAESLMANQDNGVETVLWSALRALEEKAALRRRMAEHARRGKLLPMVSSYERHAAEGERQANVLRAMLTQDDGRPIGSERAAAESRKRPRKQKRRKRR